jgi:uncharacterized protein YecE (DUF72 family)
LRRRQTTVPSPGISIGVGGWAYLPVRNLSRLELCAQIFDFVEVNSSFYKLPQLKQAEKWRASVPESFEFTVRANRKLTHENHLEPTEENFREFRKNYEICRALEARILHFQFPPSFAATREVIQNWTEFFKSLNKIRDLNIAFEIRNSETAKSSYVTSFLSEFDIIPCSDISRVERPETSSRSRIMYSRVFGLGVQTKWSFATEELVALKQKVEKVPAAKRYVTFHNMTMYEDGARMKNIINEGKDILPRREVGLESLKRSMIAARIHFPVSREDLLSEMTWRTIDLGKDISIHADKILKDLPAAAKFASIDDVIKQISASARGITQQSTAD